MGILSPMKWEWGSQKQPTELDLAYRERDAENKAQDDVQKAIEKAQIEIIKRENLCDWSEKNEE